MCIANERLTSPREVAAELDETVRHVSYHFKALEDLDCIEEVCTRPVQGGRVVEHFYRATKRPYFDDAAWENLSDNEKWGVVMPIMRLISRDVNNALAKGTFMDPDDNHVSRTPMVVDAMGWEESKEVLDNAVTALMEIQARVTKRCNGDGAETLLMKIAMIQFRSPGGEAA
jgi:hypothetical protein